MKKLFTLSIVAALAFTSCKKDETIAPKDYNTYTTTISLNSEHGKEIPVLGPPPEYEPTGETAVQYFYSVQHFVNISNKEGLGIVNSDKAYQDIVVPAAPESKLEEKLPNDGDWQIMITNYKTDAYHEASKQWYEMHLVGVLTNSNKGVKSVQVKDEKFDTISLEDASKLDFDDKVDNIGHAWQYFDMSDRKYKVLEDNYYLVKISDDEVYKLRFIDFYGDGKDKGEKGHVTFQFELLK